MKKTIFFGALAVAGLAAGIVSAGTLDDVKARGKLNCGVSTGVPGFAQPDANGVWQGFDIAVCRAVAAAVLNDSDEIGRAHV
jgi:general L-amino acid transport system substrate-binding protein